VCGKIATVFVGDRVADEPQASRNLTRTDRRRHPESFDESHIKSYDPVVSVQAFSLLSSSVHVPAR